MKFMMTHEADATGAPDPAMMAEMGKFIQETRNAGQLVLTGGLMPLSQGAQLRTKGGKTSIVDGPFAESKEVIAGFAIVEVASMDEALELSRRFLAIAGDGLSEIRPIMEG